MESRIEVGILGATGMVGQHFIKFLQGHPWFEVRWLGASDRSAGKKYRDATKWHLAGVMPDPVADLVVEECKPNNAPRLLFSATDSSVATEIERAFAHAGHVVVSNSKNHRMDRDVPLLVPEVNPDHLKLVPLQQTPTIAGQRYHNRPGEQGSAEWPGRAAGCGSVTRPGGGSGGGGMRLACRPGVD